MANYVLLETIRLTSGATSVTFNNIPQTGYTDLKIVSSSRSDRSAEVEGGIVRFNGDTTTGNYSVKRIYGNGATAASDTTYALLWGAGNTATANTFGNSELYIYGAFDSNAKSFSSHSAQETNATTSYSSLIAGLWTGTSAITSIVISPEIGSTWLSGSTWSLYGIAKTDTSISVTAPKAIGGNIVANDGTYWYHAYLSSGYFTPKAPLSCSILQIAGGGGGGSDSNGASGGGGAGGVLLYESQYVAKNTRYNVTVGSGGATFAFTSSQGTGAQGSYSQFGTLTASVGGGGGSSRQSAMPGGSGGGAGDGTNTTAWTGGAGTSGQGNAGGNTTLSQESASGGGGAGAAGSAATAPHNGGAGGVGTSTYSSWGLATTTGQNVGGTVYFAGGGGGGTYNSSGSAGSAGYGGGGIGAKRGYTNAAEGTANTGGGGGGGSSSAGVNHYGKNGGSGIIIIRYAMA